MGRSCLRRECGLNSCWYARYQRYRPKRASFRPMRVRIAHGRRRPHGRPPRRLTAAARQHPRPIAAQGQPARRPERTLHQPNPRYRAQMLSEKSKIRAGGNVNIDLKDRIYPASPHFWFRLWLAGARQAALWETTQRLHVPVAKRIFARRINRSRRNIAHEIQLLIA